MVQLGRYSSAITHHTGAQTANTRHIGNKVREQELSFVQA